MPRITTDTGKTIDDVLMQPRPDCELCHGTGKVTYEYMGNTHGGYPCTCPRRCEYCGSFGETTGTHAGGCPNQPARFRDIPVLAKNVGRWPPYADVLNDECHDRDRLAIDHAFPPITRRGDSIVPPVAEPFADPAAFHAAGFTDVRDFTAEAWDKITAGYIPANAIGGPVARNTDPHTSHTAAASVKNSATKDRAGCLAAITLYGAMTGHEIAAKLGVDYSRVHKRLPELRDAGFLQWRLIGTNRAGGQSHVYQTRNSPSGRPCVVWHLNPLHRMPGKSTETA